jgi:hypothetical protein
MSQDVTSYIALKQAPIPSVVLAAIGGAGGSLCEIQVQFSGTSVVGRQWYGVVDYTLFGEIHWIDYSHSGPNQRLVANAKRCDKAVCCGTQVGPVICSEGPMGFYIPTAGEIFPEYDVGPVP